MKSFGSGLVDTTDEHAAARDCAGKGMAFLLAPSIRHWEDRATQWSGTRDLIQIELRLIQIEPAKVLRASTFEARSSWFTFVNNPPEDLLDENFARFVQNLVKSLGMSTCRTYPATNTAQAVQRRWRRGCGTGIPRRGACAINVYKCFMADVLAPP